MDGFSRRFPLPGVGATGLGKSQRFFAVIGPHRVRRSRICKKERLTLVDSRPGRMGRPLQRCTNSSGGCEFEPDFAGLPPLRLLLAIRLHSDQFSFRNEEAWGSYPFSSTKIPASRKLHNANRQQPGFGHRGRSTVIFLIFYDRTSKPSLGLSHLRSSHLGYERVCCYRAC